MIRGPDITYNFANGLAGSFLRTAAYKQEELRPDGAVVKVNHLLLRDADSQAGMIRERGNTRGPFRNDTLSRNRQGSIDPASFDWEKLPANAWADYGTYVNRAIQLASLFQKSTWDMEEARKLFDKINTFNKTVDPDNEMSLGAILSLGIVDSIAQNLQSTGARSNMHLGDISKFARDLAGEDGIIFGNSPVPDEARDEASEIINSIVKETHIKRETMINIWLKALSGERTTYGMDVIFGGGE